MKSGIVEFGIDVKSGIVVRANGCNDNYDTDFFKKLYSEEGKGIFDCRSSILGYVQQGDIPSPFDRKNAVTLPARACDWMLRTDDNEDDENGANQSARLYRTVTVQGFPLYCNCNCKSKFLKTAI